MRLRSQTGLQLWGP